MSIFKNEDTLKTGFQFQQEQTTRRTSGLGICLGVGAILLALTVGGFIQVEDGENNNNNRRQQPAAESSLPLQTSIL